MEQKNKDNKKIIKMIFVGFITIVIAGLLAIYSQQYKPIEDKFTDTFKKPISIFDMSEKESKIHAEMFQKGGDKLTREDQIILEDNMALVESTKYREYDNEDTVSVGKYYKGHGHVEEATVSHDSVLYIIRTDGGNIVCLKDASKVRAIRDITPNSYIAFSAEGWGSEDFNGVQIPKLLVNSIELTKKVE